MTITLDTPVTDFPGVGPARAKKLEKLGILRAADLLTYYPRDYEDRRRIWSIRAAPLGEKVCVSALAAERPVLSYIRKGMELVKLRVVDNSGTLYLTFFNQSYLKNSFQPGEEYVFYGEIQEQGSRRSMVNPVFEREGDRDFTGRIVPVYPLTAGISNHLMVSLIRQAVEQCAGQGAESLPASLRAAHRLVPAERACRDIHFPEDFDALLKLPGVGRKSANLIMGDVFGKPAIVTDTHCIRLVNRMGLVDNIKDPKKVEMELWKIIPPEEGSDFCHRLVYHGRDVCTARTKPHCEECCLKDICAGNGR